MATPAEIQTAYKAIYRADLNATVASAIASSGISLDTYIAQQLPQVASTTQAAVAIASFVTGTAPTSDKLDSLKVEADKQVASYAALGVGNPSLGAYEAFGRSFATDPTTTAGFATKYGALSAADFVNVVYAQVYGTQPTAAAFANLSGQITYFTNLFTVNNVPNAALAAKGAVLGQIVGYAFVSSASANSVLDDQVQSLLTSAAKGDTTVYNKPLPIVTNPGSVGVSIALTAGVDAVSTTSAEPALRSTANNDTITGTATTITNGDKIDGGAGTDIFNATLAANTKVSASGAVGYDQITLTSIESLRVDGNAKIFDATGLTGVNDITVIDADATTAATTFTNLASTIALAVEKNNGNVTFGFGTTAAAASTELKLNGSSGVITVGDGVTGVQFGATAVTLNATTNSSGTLQLDDATSLKITGAGNTNFSITGTPGTNEKLASVDASGSTGKVGLTLNAPQVNTTVTLSGQDDIFSTDASTTKLVTVTTGAGADKVVVAAPGAGTNVSFNADNSLKTALVVADFTKGTDKIDMTALGNNYVTLTAGTQTAINAAANVKAAFDAALADANLVAAKFAVFTYGADTYVVAEGATDGLGTDTLVKITGVSGLTIGTGVGNDILTLTP